MFLYVHFYSSFKEATMTLCFRKLYVDGVSSKVVWSVLWLMLKGGVVWGVCMVQPVYSAFEFHPVGAQAAGVGDVGVAHVNGAEGLFWNPASVVFGKNVSLFLAYDRPFALAALERQAAAVSVRWGRQGVGGTYEGFGFSLYREQVLGGVYGVRVLDRVGVGVRVRSLALTVSGQESRRWLVLDLGMRVLLSHEIDWGVAAWNVSGVQTGVLGQGGQMGVMIRVVEGVCLLASVQKEADMPTGFGVGVEHYMAKALVLRVGIGSHPERFSAGFGLRHGWFEIDYAGIVHTLLGMSHRMSLHLGW
jgi:hypothetical protein